MVTLPFRFWLFLIHGKCQADKILMRAVCTVLVFHTKFKFQELVNAFEYDGFTSIYSYGYLGNGMSKNYAQL